MPKSVETSQGGKVTILWNEQVQTDRTIPNNKLDIIQGKGKVFPLQARCGPECG